MEEERIICSECGEEPTQNYVYFKDTERYVCSECLDNMQYYVCYDCDTYYEFDDDMYYRHDGEFICRHCYDGNYGTCRGCDEVHDVGELHWDDYNDCFYCGYCYDEVMEDRGCCGKYINDYHHRAELKLLGAGDENALRFGFEIEVNYIGKGWGLDDNARCVREIMGELIYDIQADGSIPHGFEIITQPMTMAYYKCNKNKIKKAMEYLRENEFEEFGNNCGVHIHFTKKPVESANTKYYEEINYILETFDKKVQEVAHRTTIYDGDYLGDSIKNGKKVDWAKMVAKLSKGRRYQLINPTPANTFEWRIFAGTTNFDVFEDYIKLAYNVVNKVINNTFIGKTFTEITGIKYDDTTRLSGISRELRYSKLIDKEINKLYIKAIKRVIEFRDNEEPMFVWSTLNIKEIGDIEIRKYCGASRLSNTFLETAISYYNSCGTRTIENLCYVINYFEDTSITRVLELQNELKAMVEDTKNEIENLKHCRDSYGQKPVETTTNKKKLRVGQYIELKDIDTILSIQTPIIMTRDMLEKCNGRRVQITQVSESGVRINYSYWIPFGAIKRVINESEAR